MNIRNECYHLRFIRLTILLWLTGSVSLFSQDYLFDTEIINVEDGLPHRMVYYIAQDKESFIWVSTQGAISRYDGYGFKTYNASFLNISDISVARLAVDANNRLWYSEISTSSAVIGVIDTAKDSIYNIETISEGLFTSKDVVYIANSGIANDEILIVTRSGIIYAYDNNSFTEVYRFTFPIKANIRCKAASDGSYWIIYSSDSTSKDVIRSIIRVKDGKIIKTVRSGVFLDSMVGTFTELIVEASPSSLPDSFWKLENDSLVPFSIVPHAPEEIKEVFQLHEEYTCYATKDALLIRDKSGKLLYRFDDLDSGGHTNKLISSTTLQDRQGILWITTQNGLIKLTARKNPFTTLLPNNGIRGIFKDESTLWVGGGSYKNKIPEGIKTEQAFMNPIGNDAMTFYKDLNDHLWIGTQANELIEYIPTEDRYIHHALDFMRYNFHLPFQNSVTQNYFIGTSNGLFRFDKINKKTTHFPLPITSAEVNIRHFHQNTQGIWIAGNKGIFLMDAEKETIVKHYTTANGLPADNILHIHEDKQGVFWLGTRDAGLIRWDLTTNSFRQYTREDELSNNKIYAVYEDDFETLWLPSDYGLMAFDKNTTTTRIYLPKDGIAHEEFNTFSHFQDKDGTLYFGGLNGITKFHPSALRENSDFATPLYTTRIRVLENNAETFTDRTVAYKSAQKISLKPGDKILELDLTLLDYEKSAENQYAYKLQGKQEQWIYTRDNKLSIINPPYGKYSLEIKARGASGQWSATPLVIPMHVQRPFYMQWWFILILAMIIITIIIVAVRWRVRKLEKDREYLEGEVQNRTRKIAEQAEALKALDKAKTRFFANITHEFRTPLTLVAGPVEQMIAKPPPPSTLKRKLSGILKNTHNLMHLINQLLDLSKLEGGRMKIEVSHGDIIRYTKELVERFQPLADAKQIKLKFETNAEIWKIHMDIDKWTKIIHNLVSNAIKFTTKDGSINVSLKQLQQADRQHIQLLVKDSGIGIAAESQEHIFNRFYQADASSTRLQGGTGIGLSLVKELVDLQDGTVTVKSAVGKGTEFTVTLPVHRDIAAKPVLPSDPQETSLLYPVEPVIENENKTIKNTKKKSPVEKLELLIIEDNVEMRRYIRSCIDATIYNVSEAVDGEEGIAKALEIVPDLIISDVMMPKKNGFEVTEAIRTEIVTSHIPLILLTAKAALESRLEGLERGADAYLTKPFSPQELALRIKKLIELRKRLQQRYQNQEGVPEAYAGFKKEDGFISELKTYIINHINNPNIGVEAISKHFAMSRMQLYRKLKAITDKPVADYIRTIRLEKALHLLKEKQLNIAEISYEAGFSSPAHFSRAFKKAYGKSPSKL